MSIQDILKNILYKSWITVILVIIFILVFSTRLSQDTYIASIGLGAKFNNEAFVTDNSESSQQYTLALDELSTYLTKRFSSVEVQSQISKKADLKVKNFDNKFPFYKIEKQGGGFVSISYKNPSEEVANEFLKAVKEVYIRLLQTEMNQTTLENFKIAPQRDFTESVHKISASIQIQILPIITGLSLGILISIVLPFGIFSRKKDKKA